MFKKMFGDKKEKEKKEKDKEEKRERKEKEEKKEKRDKERTEKEKTEEKKKKSSSSQGAAGGEPKKPKPKAEKSSKPKKESGGRRGSLRRKNKVKKEVQVDLSKPIEYPCVPEILLEYQKHKPFLKPNEEWLVVELAEFECLVESKEIISIIAKHSKFFELDPPELWEEFFEFVDDVPSYDEIINYDVWQEFRDVRYPC